MANEATIQVGMTISKRSADGLRQLIDFRGTPNAFRTDVIGTKGPTLGTINVPLTGIDVTLSEITTPGLCWLHHQGRSDGVDVGTDPSIYYVEYGVREPVTDIFYPWGELWPGDAWPVRLSRNLTGEYNVAGTGTGTGPSTNKIFLLAHGSACNVFVGVFER